MPLWIFLGGEGWSKVTQFGLQSQVAEGDLELQLFLPWSARF